MLLQVHDELIFETKEETAVKIYENYQKGNGKRALPILKITVPLIADTSFGKNWDEAH